MDQAEASGKTVEDALNRALGTLGASRDEVEFVVLDEGKRGGLFGRGGKDAVVRVTRTGQGRRQEGPGGAPDTRIPRQAQGRGQRRDAGPGGAQRGRGASGGRSSQGARGGFEQPQPRITDADFQRGSGGGAGPRPEGGGRLEGARPEGGVRRGARPPRDQGPRPDRPRRERPPRDEEPNIDPDINAVEVDFAAQTVDDLLRILDVDAEISIREPLTAGDGLGSVLAVLDIKGEDLGLLIGRRGDTLIALQYLVNLILGRKYPGRGGVTIDVEHYKHRNEERIVNLAKRMGDRVRQTGTDITLEPMSASERRLVHVTFADDPELETNSIGEGDNRKVVISLKQQ
jgi:spoIIIJ-associated protein